MRGRTFTDRVSGDALVGIRDEGFNSVGLEDLEIKGYILNLQVYCSQCESRSNCDCFFFN